MIQATAIFTLFREMEQYARQSFYANVVLTLPVLGIYWVPLSGAWLQFGLLCIALGLSSALFVSARTFEAVRFHRSRIHLVFYTAAFTLCFLGAVVQTIDNKMFAECLDLSRNQTLMEGPPGMNQPLMNQTADPLRLRLLKRSLNGLKMSKTEAIQKSSSEPSRHRLHKRSFDGDHPHPPKPHGDNDYLENDIDGHADDDSEMPWAECRQLYTRRDFRRGFMYNQIAFIINGILTPFLAAIALYMYAVYAKLVTQHIQAVKMTGKGTKAYNPGTPRMDLEILTTRPMTPKRQRSASQSSSVSGSTRVSRASVQMASAVTAPALRTDVQVADAPTTTPPVVSNFVQPQQKSPAGPSTADIADVTDIPPRYEELNQRKQ